MNTLTVGMLRDLLNTLDPNMPVRLAMNMEYDDTVNAVYVSGGDTLYFDDVTAGLYDTDPSVLFNANS